jgi:hypothetical protein
LHTVIVADTSGRPVRVQCDYCGSQHNSRGLSGEATRDSSVAKRARPTGGEGAERPPLPPVSDRERMAEAVVIEPGAQVDIELLLRRIIREETGLTPVAPAEKWRGGTMVLKPGNAALQEKTWPIETFFHKVVMLRNRLRTMEQQINATNLPEDEKIKLQGYITGCYGSLTSFNVLFADERDHFKGAGGD